MINANKNLIYKNNQDNSVLTMPRQFFSKWEKDPSKYFWVHIGYEYPKNVLPCWYVDEAERLESIKHQKQFCDHNTSEYFYLANRIDNTFIEGYIGRADYESTFLERINSVLTYFDAYNKRKPIYFTFDKITLYQVVEILPENPLRFILKRIDNIKPFKKNQAFMIMPFRKKELGKLYFNQIKPFLKNNLQIEIVRADDFRDNDIIIQTIYTLIEESEFIIADTTFENKNSFYELGYASALGKEIITIQNRNAKQKLFFDRAHIRAILYDLNDMETFYFDLESTIKSIRARQ